MTSRVSGRIKVVLLAAAIVAVAWMSNRAFADEHATGAPAAEHGAAPAAEGSHGGGHGSHAIDPKTLAFQVLNFAVLLFILIKFGGSAVNKALKLRHEQLKVSIEEAARLRAAAEQSLAEQEKRLVNLAQEIAAMTAEMKRGADLERGRLIAAAEEKARRVQEETTFLLGQQVKQAELRFRAEVAEAAVKIAGELLKRSVNAQDEQRLAQGFVAGVGNN